MRPKSNNGNTFVLVLTDLPSTPVNSKQKVNETTVLFLNFGLASFLSGLRMQVRFEFSKVPALRLGTATNEIATDRGFT